MRPHLLRLEAFGAFAGRVELDFDALADQGLVLFCGDTGSGKTTLLDALGFAIYGVVPGARSKARDLRSHHAPDSVQPWVELEFTARGRRLRVRRTPSYTRAGRASAVQATGALSEFRDGGWHPIATRLDDIGHELSTVVGLTAEQFHQVVVLPQGRFADFLQASSQEREALLRHLFAVERFEAVQEWLSRRAAAAQHALAEGRRSVQELAGRVAQADSSDVPDDCAPDVWASALMSAAVRQADLLTRESVAADAARVEADAAHLAARELDVRQQRRLAAEAELAGLRSEAEAMAELRDRVASARRASPVMVAVAATDAARGAATDASAACTETDARLRAAGLGSLTPVQEVQPAQLAQAMARCQQRQGELSVLQDAAAALERDRAEQAEARASASVSAERLAGVQADLEQRWPERLAVLQAGVEAARAGSRRLPELRAAAAAHDEAAQVAEGCTTALVALTRAEAGASLARSVAEQAAGDERTLRNRRIDAAATELAAYLEDGTPCPVCGSLAHPEPAEIAAAEASRDQERAAGAATARAQQAVMDHLAGVAALRAELAGLQERAARLPAAATGSATTARRELAEVERVVAGLEVVEHALGTAREEVASLQVEKARLETDLLASSATAERAGRRVGLAEHRLNAAVGDRPLDACLEEVTGQARLITAATQAQAHTAEVRRAAERAERELDRLASTQGFADADEARAVALPIDLVDRMATRHAAYDDAVTGLAARLAEPDLAVAVDPRVDVQAALAASESCLKRADDARERAVLARSRARALTTLAPQVAAAVASLRPLESEAAELGGLADVANGRGANRLHMPLASFVLAARLEEVAEAASLRLAQMSAGRYTLVHNDAGRDRRSRAGLDLQVDDAWTGRRRDTATLSGGETFQTALALALGLTDVVTAESGGATIETLFVDEGFGSLDPDSLDAVMDVLDALRSGGRLVGVVSHVAEMRQRIPAQVLVDKGPSGSSVRVVAGA